MLQLTPVMRPHIHIFGAGGTGGFALEYLTRLFANAPQQVTIELYDGDAVENKNLKRQNFTVADLDLMKTTALVKRMEQQVPTPPKFVEHSEYITDADELVAEVLMNNEEDETPIFVLAVDNIATRRLINQVISDLSGALDVIAIDSGNDNQGGQVVVYSNTEASLVDFMDETQPVVLKSMLELFPEIDEIKDERDMNPGVVSYCAEESESKPQAMMANVRNGELLASLVFQVSHNLALPYNVWYSDVMTGLTRGELKGVN